MLISIIIPIFNVANSLDKDMSFLLEKLKKLNYQFEIIIVDDGSNNFNEIKKIAEKYRLTYLRNERNKGKGYSIKKGMLVAGGDIRIFVDADIPFELSVLNDIICNLLKGYDLVIGDRTLYESVSSNRINIVRKTGSKIFGFMAGNIIKNNFKDTQCGIKGFTKQSSLELFSELHSKGFAFDVEIIVSALNKNFRIKKIPVELRGKNPSTVKFIKHGFLVIKELIIIKYLKRKNLI